MRYRGRFAPSPTGPLHLGSLVAALGSYLDARHHHGEWLVRIEDLDRPREAPGAADDILRTLESFALYWDRSPEYQSRRDAAYGEALAALEAQGLLYPCACSRKEIRSKGRPGPEGPVYHGACREGLPEGREARSVRMRTPPGTVELDDRIQGHIRQDLRAEVGDFVLRRSDGLFAYQLAVVVDDAWQGITHIVRGGDLLFSTPRQNHLQDCLGLRRPIYAHLPLVLDVDGRKLSKQYGALAVDRRNPAKALRAALGHLGQATPPDQLTHAEDILTWAVPRWDIGRVPPNQVNPACPSADSC